MKKLLSVLLLTLVLALGGLVACGEKPAEEKKDDPVVPTTYTVAFEVDGARYDTKKVKEGETISGTVADPTKSGFDFDGWTLNGEKVDIYTYKVNSNVTFVAAFTEKAAEDPDDNTNYFNVYIQVNGTYLTQPEAETFRDRFLATLSEEEAAITRFYIKDADKTGFAEFIAAAKDVDAVIGGNSPLKDFDYNAEYTTLDGTNLTPNVAAGHFTSTNRKIIIMTATDSLELAVKLYNFATVAYVDDTVNLTVTVHGDTDEVTTLTDSEMKIAMPTITVAEDKVFKGFATAENGEVALVKAVDAELTYNDVKDLVADGATALDLYPVIADKPTENPGLSVYIQVQSKYLTQTEAETLRDRFIAILTKAEAEKVIFHIENANADAFTKIIEDASDVDVVIGGNSPLKNFPLYTETQLANAGPGHFANDSRKVIIHEKANDIVLAEKLYTFVTMDYNVDAE